MESESLEHIGAFSQGDLECYLAQRINILDNKSPK